MRALGFAIVTLMAWLGLATSATAQAPDPYSKGPHIALKLIAESDTPAAGKTVTIAYDATPQPGWHGYWQNPGDAGFPAKLDWKLPAGVTAGTPRYPVPTTLLIAGLMNYVFEQHYTLLIDLNVPAGLAAGTKLPVKLKTQYLVCTEEICQPEAAELSLDLTVGDGARLGAGSVLLRDAAPGEALAGMPARPHAAWLAEMAAAPGLHAELKALAARISTLERALSLTPQEP